MRTLPTRYGRRRHRCTSRTLAYGRRPRLPAAKPGAGPTITVRLAGPRSVARPPRPSSCPRPKQRARPGSCALRADQSRRRADAWLTTTGTAMTAASLDGGACTTCPLLVSKTSRALLPLACLRPCQTCNPRTLFPSLPCRPNALLRIARCSTSTSSSSFVIQSSCHDRFVDGARAASPQPALPEVIVVVIVAAARVSPPSRRGRRASDGRLLPLAAARHRRAARASRRRLPLGLDTRVPLTTAAAA
jgi:hypothetical protein